MKSNPVKSLSGVISLPGDKSISHRAALFSALANGETKISNFAASADCASTLECLRKMGVVIDRNDNDVYVRGVGKTGFSVLKEPLDCGNSGTTMRMLAGILAGQDFASVMIGDDSLSKRPMKRIIEPLKLMNAEISSESDHAPLRITGRNPLQSITYKSNVASAQVKSCVLLAGLFANGKTVYQSPPAASRIVTSRNHTELMLKYLGADLHEEFIESELGFVHQVSIEGSTQLTARDLDVPADISSAAFFMVAAACLPGSEITLERVGLNPTRRAIIDVLLSLGADIELNNQRQACGEMVADIIVRGTPDAAKSNVNLISGDLIANLIDEIPVLAVFGTQLEYGLEIRNAEELRVKESDRIKTVVDNLRRMGAKIEEYPDGMRIEKSNLKGATIDSFGDHRIAMAFSIAGLFAEGETQINGSEWAAVSFPDFYKILATVSE